MRVVANLGISLVVSPLLMLVTDPAASAGWP
jgi:hypothetical protein